MIEAFFFFFLFWLPWGMWSSWARDQIWAAVATQAAAVAMLDPQPTVPGWGLNPRPSAAETQPILLCHSRNSHQIFNIWYFQWMLVDFRGAFCFGMQPSFPNRVGMRGPWKPAAGNPSAPGRHSKTTATFHLLHLLLRCQSAAFSEV